MSAYTPQVLAENSKCLCFDPVTTEKVRTYLLAVAAGLTSMTPSQLADAAKCYCYDAATFRKVQAYLSDLLEGDTQHTPVTKGSGVPVAAPTTSAALYYNTDPGADPVLYFWDGSAWVAFG